MGGATEDGGVGAGTDIYTALQTARGRLSALEAGLKHVILITDGQATYGDFDLLGRQMRRDGISVSTIAIGEDSDQTLLQKIARDGEGRYYFAADAASVPAVLVKETELAQSFFTVDRRHQPRLLSSSPIFRAATPDSPIPYLGGFVRTKAKPTAEVVLASDSNDPILATWQLGLGRVATWTSDLGYRWAGEWLRWSDFPAVLAGMVFWSAAGVGGNESGLRVSAEPVAGGARITVDSIAADGGVRDGLPTTALVSGRA